MIKMLKDTNYSAEAKRKAAIYFDVDVSTVRNHVREYRINGKVTPKTSTGRKCIFNEDIKQYVTQLI